MKATITDAILYFASKAGADTSIAKTKIAKLLFFADQAWLQSHGETLTGCEYERWQHGPVPRDYEKTLADLRARGILNLERRVVGTANELEQHVYSAGKPDLDPEVEEALFQVFTKFWKMSAKDISDYSHSLPAWRWANDREAIRPELIALKGRVLDKKPSAQTLQYAREEARRQGLL